MANDIEIQAVKPMEVMENHAYQPMEVTDPVGDSLKAAMDTKSTEPLIAFEQNGIDLSLALFYIDEQWSEAFFKSDWLLDYLLPLTNPLRQNGCGDHVIDVMARYAPLNRIEKTLAGKSIPNTHCIPAAVTSHIKGVPGRMEVVECLVSHGAPIDACQSQFVHLPQFWSKLSIGHCRTGLHLACLHGNLDMVKLMIKLRADFDKKDLEGKTAKMLAFEAGHLNIVQFLDEQASANSGMQA